MKKFINVQWYIRIICCIYREWGSSYRVFMWQILMIHGTVKVSYRGYLYAHTYIHIHICMYEYISTSIYLHDYILSYALNKLENTKAKLLNGWYVEVAVERDGKLSVLTLNYCIIWPYSIQVEDL